MELRSQETLHRCLMLALLAATAAPAAELRFDVRHERALRDHYGVLTVDERGVAYEQTLTKKKSKRKPESVRFDYADIQQLWIAPDKLVLVTYKDRKWFLGIDKEFEFFTPKGKSFDGLYPMLKAKLDQRLVIASAESQGSALWELAVKLQGTVQGSEGSLQFGPDGIVYRTARARHSRTWRYSDIENVSTSGPFQLTLTTYERAKAHYGTLKGFNFQLKEKLDEQRFQILWKRVNQERGLTFLSSIEERPAATR